MGSGKSYEATLEVVLPGILKGRRVVTNVDGINEEKIHAFLLKKNPSHQGELGPIIHVSDNDITAPGFFPDENKPDIVSIVRAGDLIVIDEAWRHWSSDKKLSHEHMQFFRMHRHHTHPDTGLSCDLALVFQSIGDIHRSLKAVVELNFKTTKLKTLGLNSSYRVEWWEGGKQTKNAFVGRRVTRYDKSIFPLYKSYSGAGGTEVSIDSRQNVLKNPRLWIMAILLVGVCAYAFWWLWGYFHPAPIKSSASTSMPVKPSVSAATSASNAAPAPGIEYRIGGLITLPNQRLVVISDRVGRLTYESTYNFSGRGVFLTGEHNHKRVDAAPFLE